MSERLLSDEELLKKLEEECDAVFRTAIALNSGKSIKEAASDIFDLINTQKRLYVESVENKAKIEAIDNILIMGSDYEAHGTKMDYKAALVSYRGDLVRAEQRARIQ